MCPLCTTFVDEPKDSEPLSTDFIFTILLPALVAAGVVVSVCALIYAIIRERYSGRDGATRPGNRSIGGEADTEAQENKHNVVLEYKPSDNLETKETHETWTYFGLDDDQPDDQPTAVFEASHNGSYLSVTMTD